MSDHPAHPPVLRQLRCEAPGFIAIMVCRQCGHTAGLPYDRLSARFGEGYPLARAMQRVICTSCGARGPEARKAKLCEPGCSRQRG